MNLDLAALLWITFTFMLAGVVKGVIGMGLPLIAMGLLTAVIGLHPAQALMLAPAFVTNVWHALAGGQSRVIFKRIWPFLICATISIWIGAMTLKTVDVRLLSALLGLLLAAYGVLGLLRPPLKVSPARETATGIAAGLVNGILAGMTGSFSLPGVPWLQAIGLTQGQLIQAMGMLFSLSTLGLASALGSQRLLTAEFGLLSVAAILPALAGMVLGQRLRQRLSERQFKLIFFTSMIVLGFYIMVQTLMSTPAL